MNYGVNVVEVVGVEVVGFEVVVGIKIVVVDMEEVAEH